MVHLTQYSTKSHFAAFSPQHGGSPVKIRRSLTSTVSVPQDVSQMTQV